MKHELLDLKGMPSIFVRGFVEYCVGRSGRIYLRDAQAAGMELVEEQGAKMSVPYVSKISKYLFNSNVFTKTKDGRRYLLHVAENFDEFVELLNTTDYGTRLKGSADDDMKRHQYLQFIEDHGSIRSTEENRIPPIAYKMLMKMVNEGQLELVIVKPGLKGGFKYNGTTELVRTFTDADD